jgi:hypothetical protein
LFGPGRLEDDASYILDGRIVTCRLTHKIRVTPNLSEHKMQHLNGRYYKSMVCGIPDLLAIERLAFN